MNKNKINKLVVKIGYSLKALSLSVASYSYFTNSPKLAAIVLFSGALSNEVVKLFAYYYGIKTDE